MSRTKYTPQEALNMGVGSKQEWVKPLTSGWTSGHSDAYMYRWYYSPNDKINRNSTTSRTYTTVNGSATVTMSGDDHFPKLGQWVEGTGIASDSLCIARPTFNTFTMDKVATASGTGVTDIELWDQDPSLPASTIHLDVTDVSTIFTYAASTFQYSFTSTPTDVQKLFANNQWWNVAENNEASFVHVSGNMEFTVPLLGKNTYFNILPMNDNYNGARYMFFAPIGGEAQNCVF